MPETPPLPSREAVQASMDNEFGDLALVYQIADEWVSGRLVDREATKELVQAAAEAMQADPTLAAVFVAALGGTDNEEGDGS